MVMLIFIALPLVAGALWPLLKIKNRTAKLSLLFAVLAAEAVLAALIAFAPEQTLLLWKMTDALTIVFTSDGLAKLFAVLVAFGWLLTGVFAFVYMKHEQSEDRFFCFMLLSEGALAGMSLAGNLIAMYLCYEALTLCSMPLVLHSLQKDSIAAALKYLFYSIAGAFMVLLGIFFLSAYTTGLDFVPGGTLDLEAVSGHEKLLLGILFVTVIGAGTKAGMYPMHGWLPTAHPVAPAPASAVLSGLIAKAGVLFIARILYYIVGADFLRGTWVQTALLSLALLTVFMGSMMAYTEKVLKKRLAYSTVSQISYVLTGLFLLSAQGVQGAILQIVFHAMVKVCLFLCAGAIIFMTGKTRVDQLRGIGKEMPITLWCFALASLSLIGIPPTGGFVSKWYLATAALQSGLGVFSWLAPVILLISALLTAGYLLPIVIDGFFPGKSYTLPAERKKEPVLMWLPLVVLAALAVVLGMFPGWLTGFAGQLSALMV